ncbi:hypothetical protein ACFQ9V_05620 [Leifsonia sp. NPDC056665]|uniref:hypothetical protein n=1 Tax=Leifsonia sp. NPDC056665 TaxID=3345901 RepID=UPI0036D139E4
MYAYYSLAADFAEPYLLDLTIRGALRRGIGLEVKTYKHWGHYRMSMQRRQGPAIFSTHGRASADSPSGSGEWAFSSLRYDENGRRDWWTVSENFSANEPFAANLLIVLACSADEVDWERYVRKGAFAVVSEGELTAGDCASAVLRFWDRVPDLNSFDLTYSNVAQAWSDSPKFRVISGRAPASLSK